MSFGFSIGDFITVAKLASNVVSGARKACGAHDDLTREVTSLHIVLRQLEREVVKPNSILKSDHAERKAELATLVEHCYKVLEVLDSILEKYNGLSEEKRKVTKLWKRVKFGNGEMQDLSKIRLELATHTNVITMFLNLLAVGSLGKVEEEMITQSDELRAMRRSVHWVAASLEATTGHNEGSILTSYANDDKAFWKEFRRELVKEGYSSSVLRNHKTLIRDYVKELGDRGALDDLPEAESESNAETDNLRTTSSSLQPTENPHGITQQAPEAVINSISGASLVVCTGTVMKIAPEIMKSQNEESSSFELVLNSSSAEDETEDSQATPHSRDGIVPAMTRDKKSGVYQAYAEDATSDTDDSLAAKTTPERTEEETMVHEDLPANDTEQHAKSPGQAQGKETSIGPRKWMSYLNTLYNRLYLTRGPTERVFMANADSSFTKVCVLSNNCLSEIIKMTLWRDKNDSLRSHTGPAEDIALLDHYPPHTHTDGVFWISPPTEGGIIDFVYHHISGRWTDEPSARAEVVHDGRIFVVPGPGDALYAGRQPSFAYNDSGDRVAISGPRFSLIVRGKVSEPAYLLVTCPWEDGYYRPGIEWARNPFEDPVGGFIDFLLNGKVYRRYGSQVSQSSRYIRNFLRPTISIAFMGYAEISYATAYIQTVRRDSTSKFPSGTPSPFSELLVLPVMSMASNLDVFEHDLDASYLFSNWSSTFTPVILFGSVLDVFCLGKWIYDWTVSHDGATSSLSDTAGNLWVLLTKVSFSAKKAEYYLQLEYWNRSRRQKLEELIQSAKQLIDKFKSLVMDWEAICGEADAESAKNWKCGRFRDAAEAPQVCIHFVSLIVDPDQRSSKNTITWMKQAQKWMARFHVVYPGYVPVERDGE